jgi:hypothetical protein
MKVIKGANKSDGKGKVRLDVRLHSNCRASIAGFCNFETLPGKIDL